MQHVYMTIRHSFIKILTTIFHWYEDKNAKLVKYVKYPPTVHIDLLFLSENKNFFAQLILVNSTF